MPSENSGQKSYSQKRKCRVLLLYQLGKPGSLSQGLLPGFFYPFVKVLDTVNRQFLLFPQIKGRLSTLVHLSDQPGPGTTAFLIRYSCFLIARLNRLRSLQALGFPSGRGKPHHMGHIRPLALRSRSIESISPDILRSTRWDVLCKLKEKTYHREGFGFSLLCCVAHYVV